jgi:GT2 family glycosyltransferase
MQSPVASLIISVYDNVNFLKCVLASLKFQTDKRFEVIISEDAEHESMKNFLSNYNFEGELFHLTQPDQGWQKNKALNRAAQFAHTNHLIFIDGDCVLHPRFIEFHIKMFNEKHILAGKRIKLDPLSSDWMLQDDKHIAHFHEYLRKNYFRMKKNGAGFMEEGFFINPGCVLGFIPKVRKMYQLKGCNMSFSKKALYDINGFDEDYIRPAIGEDIDLVWRFEGLGYRLKSLRNLAVQYHLFHKENWVNQDENVSMMMLKKANSHFKCIHGIVPEKGV